ncbi:unnamed protein product [Macrosiphum euphorbiae]|uniref:Uncharacterized protein n=1 Tax=Macrosiphum euphorbiae TaxID=13131 RepID=A0AAV0WL83_9HEMI|nr:unnamed protein product [Macrosiphum euphorbiae]
MSDKKRIYLSDYAKRKLKKESEDALFNKSNNSSLINPGFNDWKKSHEKVKEHENSAIHRKSMLTWLDRVNTKNRIDKTMTEQMLSEKKYFSNYVMQLNLPIISPQNLLICT